MGRRYIDSTFEFEDQMMQALNYVKPIFEDCKCEIHGKKLRVRPLYDDDGIYAEIYRYCCREFAETVQKAIEATEEFDAVYIEDKK